MPASDSRRLTDQRDIENLLVDYCRYLDRMDLDSLADLFLPDAQVEYGEGPLLRSEGNAALRMSLTRMWRWKRTAHHLSNVRIWFEGEETARGESSVLAWHENQTGGTAIVWGLYRDLFRLTQDGWRIATRRMEMQGADSGFGVPLYRFERLLPEVGWTPPEGLG